MYFQHEGNVPSSSYRTNGPALDDLSILDIYLALGGRISPRTRDKHEINGTCWGSHTNGTANYNLYLNEKKGVWSCHCTPGGGGKLALIVLAGQASDEKDAFRWLIDHGLLAEREHSNSVKPRTVATYQYEDESGGPIACVDRVEPGRNGNLKDFYPRLWDGTKYAFGLQGRKLPLYGLSRVRRSIDAGERLFLTEGEGKADKLRAALEAAKIAGTVTTIPGGCKAPLTDERLQQLRGLKSAVILADSDAPGREAARVRAELIVRELDAEVKLIDLYPDAKTPEHPAWAWDVADFLKDGGTIETLLALIESAPLFTPNTATADPEEDGGEGEAQEWPDEKAAPWPKMDPEAFHGLAGDLIASIEAETEADPIGLLLTLLTAFGSAAGPRSFIIADGAPHSARLFAVLVGGTSTGRKGTSLAVITHFLLCANEEWFKAVRRSGFGSGEAIIADLAGDFSDSETPSPYPGQALVIESEFGRLLAVNGREGSTTSHIIRDAWDGGTLSAIRRAKRACVEGAHLSMLGHVTPEELNEKLTPDEVFNGFANRCLFVCVRRSKKLPSGGYLDPKLIGHYGKRLRVAMDFARKGREMKRTPAAEKLWTRLYLEEPEIDGILGAFTARGPAQMLRLSVAYALLDMSPVIDVPHLQAAAAVWRYCIASVSRRVGFDLSTDERKLLDELRRVRRDMTVREIDRLFSGNRSAREREQMVGRLIERKLAISTKAPTKKPSLLVRALSLSDYGKDGKDGKGITTPVSQHPPLRKSTEMIEPPADEAPLETPEIQQGALFSVHFRNPPSEETRMVIPFPSNPSFPYCERETIREEVLLPEAVDLDDQGRELI